MELKGIKMKELIFAIALALTNNCEKDSQGGKVKTFGPLDALNDARTSMIDIETYHQNPYFNFDNMHAIDPKWGAVLEPLQQGIINYLKGNVDSSIVNYENALNDIKNLDKLFKNKYRIGALKNVDGLVFYCLGNSYMEKGTYEVALNYYELALERFKALKFERGISDVIAEIATLNKRIKKNDAAAKNYREAIKMKKRYNESIREKEKVIQLYREFSEVLYEAGHSDSFFIYNTRADSLEKEMGKIDFVR